MGWEGKRKYNVPSVYVIDWKKVIHNALVVLFSSGTLLVLVEVRDDRCRAERHGWCA